MTLCRPSRCGCSFQSDTLDVSTAASGLVTIEMPDAYEFAYPIFTFLNDTERDAEITDPQEGQEAWLRSEDSKYRYVNGAWVLVSRGQTTYTPTTTNLTVGSGGSATFQYSVRDGEVIVNWRIILGTGFALPGNPTYTVPVTMGTVESVRFTGPGVAYDLSASRMHALAVEVTGSIMIQYVADGSGLYPLGSTNPFTWAAGDEIWGTAMYPTY